MTEPDLSIVVPVFNSESSLPTLVERLDRALAGTRLEIVFVNDGSADRSWSAIVELSRRDDRIVGVNLMRNYGQPNALLAGIRAARGERTVLMDDDLQHPPEEIPKLIEELDRGFDVVYGTPRDLPHSPYRNLTSWLLKVVLKKAMGTVNARSISSFMAFRTAMRDVFAGYESPFVSIDVLLSWGTTKFSAVTVEHARRQFGGSNYTFRKLAAYALTMITGFSTLPLRLASLIGFVFTAGGIAALAYVLAVYFTDPKNVPGFTFLASIVAIFSGAQLFALGIIGEYLSRMYARLLGSPAYVVSETTGPGAPARSP